MSYLCIKIPFKYEKFSICLCGGSNTATRHFWCGSTPQSQRSNTTRQQLQGTHRRVVALQLELDEYRKQHKQDLKRIRSLGVRLRRVESVAKTASKSEVHYLAPRHDTVIVHDTVSIFRWSDGWTKAEGVIRKGEVECKVESVDTLRQVVHRVPRRFGAIRYGTKAIRQEILSSNPNTQIVYTEYIELPKRRKRR